MSTAEKIDLETYTLEVAQQAKQASQVMASLSASVKVAWLRSAAAALRDRESELTAANALDITSSADYCLTDAQVDRLRLTPDRIEGIAAGLEEIAALPDPVGSLINSTTRPNGLRIDKVRCPLGVVLFIYESRPNVTADAAAICAKAGNAVILRGGKEARHSSRAIVDILARTAKEAGVPEHAVQLVETTDRAAVGQFLKMSDWIDVAIPRGGEGLIRRVAAEATMPVIKHFDGNCHVYVDADADLAMAEAIVVNSKCQRMGVCNAAESLLIHADVAEEFLPRIAAALTNEGVEIRGCPRSCDLISSVQEATDEDYAAEFLGPTISVRITSSIDEAIDHVNRYGSGHTDSIVTRSDDAARAFADRVDSSAVMINASTRFNDGAEFGLGAEIGISTDKFHARGPCGIEELTSYKYVVNGTGQLRT
ncbi:MAG: glutamate-5-semialdehyde dehydrogenase [Aeoliella sp.]